MDKLRQFLKTQEGSIGAAYKDHEGTPTVGIGTNLNSPEVPQLLEAMGKSREGLISGQEELSEQERENLMDAQLQEKHKLLKSMLPKAKLSDNEEQAALSLMYNSPKLIGPNMKKHLESGDKLAATREIILNSNKDGLGGVMKRRLDEAHMFAGDKFPEIMENLSPEEKITLESQVDNIQNPHERKRVFQKLSQLINGTK